LRDKGAEAAAFEVLAGRRSGPKEKPREGARRRDLALLPDGS
jgi:hypothetical protein